MALEKYRKKRNFKKTPEPQGAKKPGKIPIFVVQKHYASHLHYDFRLEAGGVLKSWAVPKGPSLNPKEKKLAMLVEDHPLDYANFEGTIPQGNYGAGKVIIWDTGTYELKNLDFEQAFQKGDLKFFLHGSKLNGEFALVKIKGKKGNEWLLLKKQDDFATDENILEDDITQLPAGPMPHNVKPMLSKLSDEPFDSPDWIFEIKWDGYRAIAEIENQKIKLYSRNLQNFALKYFPVVEALKNIKQNAVLDGEIVVVNEKGISQFQLLQDWERDKKGNLIYAVFDILFLDGKNLQNLPLIKRKEILRHLIFKNPGLQFSDYVKENGIEFFNAAQKQGLEGIMAKKAESFYQQGKRSDDWQKIKILNQQEAIICGFTEPRKSRKHFGALVLGVYKGKDLVYIGHTGGGFNDKTLPQVIEKLKPLAQKESPFKTPPKTNSPVTWVKPELVCQVKFQQWTADGHMRQPIFLGLRDDKKSENVFPEIPKEDKVFWPEDGYKKSDLVAYYKKISSVILPYLKDRPQSLNRHPNGIYGPSFFQKNLEKHPSWVKTVPIKSDSEERTINYVLCNDQKTLLYLANLGCIEINPWSSRIQNLENPDYAIFDIDPHQVPFFEAVKAALEIKKILDQINIVSFCKTSGKAGLHILVPTGGKYSYEIVRIFAEIIMHLANKKLPQTTSVERRPQKRENKIYLDFLQNRIGQTIAAPYSLRPVKGALVSTPVEWREVNKDLDPSKFTIKTIFERLNKKGDILKPMLSSGNDLKKAIASLEFVV